MLPFQTGQCDFFFKIYVMICSNFGSEFDIRTFGIVKSLSELNTQNVRKNYSP